MAQTKVTNFFTARKRNSSFQPSKRLKIQHVPIDAYTDLQNTKSVDDVPSQIITKPDLSISEATSTTKQVEVLLEATTTTATKSIPKSTSRSKRQVSSTKSQPTSLRVTRSSSRSSSPVSDASSSSVITLKEQIQHEDLVGKEEYFATAACDDHTISPPNSPSKQSFKSRTVGKKNKHPKSMRKDLLSDTQPEVTTGYDFSKFLPNETRKLAEKVARKRLVMKRRNEHVNEKRTEAEPEDEPKELSPSTSGGDYQKNAVMKTTSIDLYSKTHPKGNAPVENKTLDPVTVRTRLAKSGKLAELQERLSQFSTAVAKVKKDKQIQRLTDLKSEKEKANEAAKPKTVPAFERYHSLAEPVPPGLTLPYKYRLLMDVYHAVDTVVSMLHKRSEVCTFSKLKKAVQVMTRKTFEEKNLAQIKSVFPAGLNVRQEKGLVIPGTGNHSNWQLTIEANLQGVTDDKDCPRANDGRAIFTATKLLERKSLFHHLLIDIVKDHHKEFLANLERPLSVADEKVTRWHPRFRVDQVPDIVPAQLPQPPDTKKFTTAIEVLEAAHTKNLALNARVQRALENVAKQKKAAEMRAAAAVAEASQKTRKAVTGQNPHTEMKGIPQGLLERIRAKEAEKAVRSMMLTPATEKRNEQISRLPDVVRIIRSCFVMYKKPCVPMEEVIKKVSVSAKSSMGTVEAEAHIKLLLELVPEWASAITVRKGTYLKIDCNQELAAVMNKLNEAKKHQQ